MNNMFELIRRIRTEEPRADVAANAARWYGILCLVAVAWNAFMAYVMPFEQFPVRFEASWVQFIFALVTLSGVGALLASRFLKDDPVTGSRAARIALWIGLAALVLLVVGFWKGDAVKGPEFFAWVARIGITLVFAQFVVPGGFWHPIGRESPSCSSTPPPRCARS